METEVELKDEIWHAFHEQDAITPSPVNAYKYGSEGYEETRAFLGKDWSELNVEMFEESRVFSFIPANFALHVLGAYMWLVISEGKYEESIDTLHTLIDRPKYKKKGITFQA